MTSPTLWWISASAACQEICSNCPEPFTPTRRSGCSRRCGPCTKAVISRATLVQLTPAVDGIACDVGADDPGRERHRVGAAHFRDAAVVDRDRETAGVGTVEGANAWVFFEGHKRAR